jgi:prepilin-type N-terminal cleavage/methylation domain-containing protein
MTYSHSQSAFSLVEVLVAITILLLVVVTPMTIMTRINNSTASANEQFVAYFLAQEGLELVQRQRDNLFLEHYRGVLYHPPHPKVDDPINLFRTSTTFTHCYHTDGCGLYIDNAGSVIATAANCSNSSSLNCRLYKRDTERSRYVHINTGTSITPYTRRIRITEGATVAGKISEFKVTSTVEWRTGSLIAGQKVELVTYLANTYDTN